MKNVTRTIFLKLISREEVAGEIAGLPFNAFVKFVAEGATKSGGTVTLDIRAGGQVGQKIGSIIIDWPTAESRRPQRRGRNYIVATGKIDHVEPNRKMTWKLAELIVESMKNAGWVICGYNPQEDPERIDALFQVWIRDHL